MPIGDATTYFGAYAYANFNLTLVDDGEVHIGEHTMIGPNCTIITTGHPIRPDLREKITQYSLPVTIGRNVWLGANVTVLPGVTIGNNSVIGACSLVTKDIPANVVAFGQPCKVYREIGEHDDVYYWRDRMINPPYDQKQIKQITTDQPLKQVESSWTGRYGRSPTHNLRLSSEIWRTIAPPHGKVRFFFENSGWLLQSIMLPTIMRET